MYPRIEDAGHYSPFHTIPFLVADLPRPLEEGQEIRSFLEATSGVPRPCCLP